MFKRGRPFTLQELSIVECKMKPGIAFDLFEALKTNSNLAKLTFSDSNVFLSEHTLNGPKAFDMLLNFIAIKSRLSEAQTKKQILTHLDLSNNSFSAAQLASIMENLENNITL